MNGLPFCGLRPRVFLVDRNASWPRRGGEAEEARERHNRHGMFAEGACFSVSKPEGGERDGISKPNTGENTANARAHAR